MIKQPSANQIINQISATEIQDLGEGKFSVRLRVATPDGTTEILSTHKVVAERIDSAVEKAKIDFVHWLEITFDLATERAA